MYIRWQTRNEMNRHIKNILKYVKAMVGDFDGITKDNLYKLIRQEFEEFYRYCAFKDEKIEEIIKERVKKEIEKEGEGGS